jgi:hypothetical protein
MKDKVPYASKTISQAMRVTFQTKRHGFNITPYRRLLCPMTRMCNIMELRVMIKG